MLCWEGGDGADFTRVTHEGLKSSKEKGGFHLDISAYNLDISRYNLESGSQVLVKTMIRIDEKADFTRVTHKRLKSAGHQKKKRWFLLSLSLSFIKRKRFLLSRGQFTNPTICQVGWSCWKLSNLFLVAVMVFDHFGWGGSVITVTMSQCWLKTRIQRDVKLNFQF